MFPPSIVFVNGDIDGYGSSFGDLNATGKLKLQSQLYIDETITSQEFDLRISTDPNYPQIVHNMNYRIMVIKPNFSEDQSDLQYADVVLYITNGMATVKKNNYGDLGLTLPIERLEIHQLLRYNNSSYVAILPQNGQYPYSRLGGIFAIQSRDTSGVHDANTDNEMNNESFINRK